MQTRLLLAAIIAATPILALSPAAFPDGDDAGCVRATVGARKNQRQFMSLMQRHDDKASHALGAYRVPHVKSRDVKQVSDPRVCQKAAMAYGKALRDESPSRKVHILHIGGRFVVVDPAFAPDKRRRIMTFDSSFSRPLAVVSE